MKKLLVGMLFTGLFALSSFAQDSTEVTILTLEDAINIALSENTSVKVADQEIKRTEYALKGTYASLFPQIDASAAYQRTIKKQVMYMDFDMGSLGDMGGDIEGAGGAGEGIDMSGLSENPAGGGIEVGRWNTYSAGLSASMPLVNAQLWTGIKISAQDVELAVEKARSSRLEMVTQVKQAFFSVLLAKEASDVYLEVYNNAVENFRQTEKRYNVQKASELDYTRAKSSVANAIPNVYDSESAVILALWQLKAVIGMDLDMEIDVAGDLEDYAVEMFRDINEGSNASLENNSTMKQLAIQAEQLSANIKMQQYASLPTIAATFSYSQNAMTNDFKFSEYQWSPHSFVGLSISIPIFAGGKRHNAVRQSRVQAQQLELQAKETERQLQIAIRQYLTQMETQMKTYDSACEAVETARKAYDIAVKSYNVGRGTITDLNDAQLALTQSQLGQSQAIFNFQTAKANLEQTLGVDLSE